MKFVILLGFLFASIHFVNAQEIDSTLIETSVEIDTSSNKKSDSKIKSFFNIFKGKPGRAALYSLVIPGGGQVYNRKYWKAPIVWGIEATYTYLLISSSNSYNEYKDAYVAIKNGSITSYNNYGESQVLSYRNSYRLAKEKYAVYLGITHLLSVIDAFVDRHLMDFNIDEDLSLDVIQERITPQDIPIDYVGFQLKYRF